MTKPMSKLWADCSRASAPLVFLMLTGCQALAIAPVGLNSEIAQPSVDAALKTVQKTTQSAAGLVLLAEYALKGNHLEEAMHLYLDAARRSKNPDVAARAASLARQIGTTEDSKLAITHWLRLAPNTESSLEASFIFETEQGNHEIAGRHLKSIVSLNTNYRANWLGSFWSELATHKKSAFLDIAAQVAEVSGNTSLAITVAEIKNRIESKTGNVWIDRWLKKHSVTSDVALFRARMELPDHKLAMQYLRTHPSVSRDLDVLAQLARWAGLEGNEKKARELLTEVVENDQSRHADTLTLALLEMQHQQFSKAEKLLKKLLASDNFRANAYFYLGEIARKTNRPKIAIERFLRVDRPELIVEARKQLATLAIETKVPASAHAWFAEARLLFQEENKNLYVAEAQFQTSNGMADKAIVILTEALEQHLNNREILYTRALAYEQKDNMAKAEADLRTILVRNPEDADALNALGYMLADRTYRLNEALELIKKALEKKPDSPAILDSMGWVLHKLGNSSDALPHFVKAWNVVRDDEIAAHYGEVLWTLGRQVEAKTIWNIGYESNPESGKIRTTIKRLINS